MYVSPIDKLDHYSPPVVVTNPDSRFALFSAIWTGGNCSSSRSRTCLRFVTKLTSAFRRSFARQNQEERACKLSGIRHKTVKLFPPNGAIRLKARLFGGYFSTTDPSFALSQYEELVVSTHPLFNLIRFKLYNKTSKSLFVKAMTNLSIKMLK